MARYIEEVLTPHIRIWDEAMLAASIWFLKEELGIDRIFYHTFETGTRLKAMRCDPPPRSIYSTLPKRFLFEQTEDVPRFLTRSRSRRIRTILNNSPRFYLLKLGPER